MQRSDKKMRHLFEQIEKFRSPGTLITSNTSGIPIKQMNEGRSEDFRKNFAVTHFFNPPRYLKLFEIIPGPDCDPNIIDLYFINLLQHQLLNHLLLVFEKTLLAKIKVR